MNVDTGGLLRNALARTCSALPTEVLTVPLEHWDESVFRWLLIRHVLALAPGGTPCWSEWHRVDLVLPSPFGATLIELKFFAHRLLRNHSPRIVRMKGGPVPETSASFSVRSTAWQAAPERLGHTRAAESVPVISFLPTAIRRESTGDRRTVRTTAHSNRSVMSR